MAKIRMKASTEDFEKAAQDQGDFVVPANGYYVLTLKECNDGYSKDEDGKEDKKRPRLECIYEITGVGVEDEPVTENYGNIWDYVSFSKDSGWRRGQFLKAFGISDGTEAFDDEFDTDELIGQRVIARLARERGRSKDDPPRARLRSMVAFEDGDVSSAFGDDGDDDDAEAEGDYTEAELKDMDLKELGALAKEDFSLDPKDSIVKVKGKVSEAKTKTKLIAAILAAQEEGGSEPADDEDDGENPF